MEGDNKQIEKESVVVPESPKPLAFTIDFNHDKKVDVQRHKTLAEKFQNRHKRGQSLSKLEDSTTPSVPKSLPLTGNLPRKSSFQSEGYFSSDEKPERAKSAGKANNVKRSDLTLFLKNVTTDRMTQSFPNSALPCITSPEDFELKNVSSPEFDLISPYSPRETNESSPPKVKTEVKPQVSIPENNLVTEDDVFVDGNDFDFDKKSDTVSDAGTYTLDTENYSEEQKARMSIDKDFRIEEISVHRKTEEYVQSLATVKEDVLTPSPVKEINPIVHEPPKILKSPLIAKNSNKLLSPILSPTQNLSITDTSVSQQKHLNNGECDLHNQTFTKILFPSPKARQVGLDKVVDQGAIISVTSSGAFRSKSEEQKRLERKWSLSKSEVQVEAYIDGKSYTDTTQKRPPVKKLTATIVNVQSIEVTTNDSSSNTSNNTSPILSKYTNVCGLPPSVGGKVSPTKIPSPIHTMSRPRTGVNAIDFSDTALDTEIILRPTQNYINTLQQKLSLDSDPDSDYDAKYGLQLNNTAHLLKQRASHTRHNSLDDRTMNNKLEHFQSKNLSGIDQTYSNLLNQYSQSRVIQKIHNSPNNSPIRRSSSFTTKNHINAIAKNTNLNPSQKGSNLCNSPNLGNIHRSSSTASIKPALQTSNRRSSISDHKKIDRSQFGDTESSSEEDFEKTLQKRKDLGNISNTRCNRAFSLRRARADSEVTQLKCPNTPEMRRKNFDMKPEQRAISVDRKPTKTNDVQSRYMLNVTKRGTPPPAAATAKETKHVPKAGGANATNSAGNKVTNKPQTFARTDSGRFSMRASAKPPLNNTAKSGKKETGKAKQGGRSNSSLTSREVDFQNWKRRKSYDPMKAAAEGKKKEIQKRQSLGGPGPNAMTQSCYAQSNHSPESSPSHSSSVHRSQSFHGTAALEQLISSDEEEDLTLSADEGFSPPTPSPCELSPTRASLRHTLWERIHH